MVIDLLPHAETRACANRMRECCIETYPSRQDSSALESFEPNWIYARGAYCVLLPCCPGKEVDP
jgi:hypothetical protein